MERDVAWKKYDEADLEALEHLAAEYIDFISDNKTERECAASAVALAEEHGYLPLDQAVREGRTLKAGDKVWAQAHGKALILAHLGQRPLEQGLNILGAHIDSPRLDLKQNPLYESNGFTLFDTHYYGGIKNYQWVTLPLALHGVIAKTDGTVVMVDNPHNYPDPAVIELAEEPYAKVSIVSPPDYVGNIMPMCQERRGEFKDMQYLDTNLVELHYSMPLGEIIYDFFDTLKARTKGYASLDYELDKYEPSELVKVDMLLNGDQVDALSFIAHREKAYPRARRLCEKLRDNIPRQLFEVPVQAAIGGKVIARETVRAMRKDVLAKCYGGDITRKKKLLEKQKEGKKKMRSLGTVQIPTEAFMAVLKLDEE